MRTGFVLLACVLGAALFPGNVSRAEVISSLWQTQKTQHFIIYHQGAPADYVTRLSEQAERYYDSVTDRLGYRSFSFWSWDDRAKIFLYPDSASYLGDTRRAAWSGASVNVKTRTISTFIGQETFIDSMLPHELAHIIFREFVGHRKDLPLWLDEGVAGVQEEAKLAEHLRKATNLIKRGVYIGLKDLSEIRDYSLVVPQVFYAESCSLVNFLLEKYGKDKFLDFSRALRDKADWQDALERCYQFRNQGEFETQWKEYYLRQDRVSGSDAGKER